MLPCFRKNLAIMKPIMINKRKVSIVIPTKNEAKTVKTVIKKCQKYASQVIVIDGHSTDQTQRIVKSLGVQLILDNKKGKGAAMRKSMDYVNNDVVVFIDADGSHDPNDIPKLVKPILQKKADYVIASRMLGGSDELHGSLGKFIRLIGSEIITIGINLRFKSEITDSQNGFRAIKKSVLKDLNLKENITTIEQEMLMKVLKKGYKVVEISSHEYARKYGHSKIEVKKMAFRYVYSWIKYMILN